MKTTEFTLTILLFALISFSLQAQTTYYIDATNGNDSNNGLSPSSAWRSIQKVVSMSANFQAGDSILFKKGEEWDGHPISLSYHPSGNIFAPITYSSYGTGAKPIINVHTEQNPTWTYQGNHLWTAIIGTGARFFKNGIEMLRAVNLSYLGLFGTEYYTELINEGNNFKLYCYSTTNPNNSIFSWSPYSEVFTLMNSNYIHISDLDFRGGALASIRLNNNMGWKISNCNIGQNASKGIIILNSRNITINDCQIDAYNTIDQSQLPDTIPGSSYSGCTDGILVTSGSSNITIYNCFFKNWGHASFGANTDVDTTTISHITFYNNELTSPDILYGGRIAYSGYSEDGEYYNNYIHNISVQSQLGGSRNHFHHNIIDTVLDSPLKPDKIGVGIMLQNYLIQVKDNLIENNLIANTESEGIVLYSVNFALPGEVSGNIIRNNIIYNCGNKADNVGLQFHKDRANQSIYNNIVENNLIYNDSTTQTCRYQYNGTISDPFTFNTQDTDIHNNIGGNPLFINAANGNYHLEPDAPAIDAGVLPLSTFDYDGNPIPNGLAADIGIYEYYETLGISNHPKKKIAIHPNPATGRIFLPKRFNNSAYTLYSVTSRIVQSGLIKENSIDVNNLKRGLYFITITDVKTGNNQTAKIVKQ